MVKERIAALLEEAVQRCVRDGLLPAGQYRVDLETPRQAAHGDFAANVALVLSKQHAEATGAKKPDPRGLARAIVDRIEDREGLLAARPVIAGPEIVRKLARVERVRILVQDRAAEAAARRILRKSAANLAAVEFFHAPTDRGWTRDYCPLFVRNRTGEVALTNWRFNAWAKYDDWKVGRIQGNRRA